MEKKAKSGMMLTLLLVSMLTLTHCIQQVQAKIVKIQWIDPTYYGYDAFFGKVVVAYRSGSVAKIAVTLRNDLFPPDTILNVSAVEVGFDWGMSYASTEVSPQDPFELSWWEARAFNVSFTVPPTTVASDTVLHEFQIRVEHVDAQSNIVGSWVLVFSNFAVYPEPIMASLDIDPNTLNSGSKGRWITAHIQLHEDYSSADIDASAIMLNGTIAPVLDPKYGFVTDSCEYLVDYNNDCVLERMVKFDRATVASWICQSVGMQHEVSLTITGGLTDGTPFEGTDIIFVICGGRQHDCQNEHNVLCRRE